MHIFLVFAAGSALILADSSWFMLIVYAILFALLYFKYGKSEGAAVQAQSTAEKSGTPVKEEDARQMQQQVCSLTIVSLLTLLLIAKNANAYLLKHNNNNNKST